MSIVGCDEDSTEIEKDDKIRLSLNVVNSTYDSQYVTGKKDFDLTIKLYKDSVNQQTGLTESDHISVSTSGIFVLELDEISYDLFDYYNPDSLISDEGSYRITLDDIESNINSLSIKLTLNGQEYKVDSLIPAPFVVSNHAFLAENYDPLNDDILIDWEPSVLPTNIEGIQTVFYKENSYCSKDKYGFVVPTDVFSHYIYKEDMNHGCVSNSKETIDIKTSVSLVQSTSDFPFDSVGFDNVSTYFENNYQWLAVTQY